MFPRDDLAGALAEGSNFHVIDYDGEVEDVSNIKDATEMKYEQY